MFKTKCLLFALALLCTSWAHSQTLDEIRNNKNPDHVLSFGMSPDLKMWSPLKQINKSNIKRLVPVWSFSTANPNGELAQPTVPPQPMPTSWGPNMLAPGLIARIRLK